MKMIKIVLFLCVNLAACVSAVTVDRINVTDYGAIPNDGASDTAAINAAVAAGTSVYFPPGSYNYIGRITLPTLKSYRLYGDGPGVSIIAFTGPTAGIYASNVGQNTLNVEGLTLRANTTAAGDAISATFTPDSINLKFHTATIHNVVIDENKRDGTGGYWTRGIYLYRAENAVIDKVDISGTVDVSGTAPKSITGIVWASPTTAPTTGIQITNAEIKFFKTAVQTSGWVEGFYMSGFEVVLCGSNGAYAMDLASSRSTSPSPSFNLVNGHVNMIAGGVKMTNLASIKVSNIDFAHVSSGSLYDGTHLQLTNCPRAIITDNTFTGSSGKYANENGVFLTTTQDARISGNVFSGMLPTSAGSCIVAYTGSTTVRVTDNIFDSVLNAYSNYIGTQFYYDADNIIK